MSEPTDDNDRIKQLEAILQNGLGDRRYDPKRMAMLEWRAKVTPPIRPGMSPEQIKEMAEEAAGNAEIRKLEALWLALGHPGRVQVYQDENGERFVRVKGIRPIAEGWKDVPTLITDATGDPELLKYIWPDLKCSTTEWEQMPRPESVRVFQVLDCSFSMGAIVPTGKEDKLKAREDRLRRTWGAVLASAAQYGGEPVGVVIYKGSRQWIKEKCFVPPWIRLAHHGATAGSNAMEKVRAFYAVGRLMPRAEAITSMAEALCGEYIADREFVMAEKSARIHLAPNPTGFNTAWVDAFRHPHPVADRLRRQRVEGDALQTFGRPRVNLRDAQSPLDVYLFHDVALPMIGDVIPVLLDELPKGPEVVMLATAGVILENAAHAEMIFPGLVNQGTMRNARSNASEIQSAMHFCIPGRDNVSGGVSRSPIKDSIIRDRYTPQIFHYQITGKGQKEATVWSMTSEDATRALLETRLGPLKAFRRAAKPAG